MFTGIIDHSGIITRIEIIADSLRLWIQTSFVDLTVGESIAVDGICLTVAGLQKTVFLCAISTETLRVTNANHFMVGKKVNLERAMLLSSRLGGHLLSGHIDQTCFIKAVVSLNEYRELHFSGLEPAAKRFVMKKGSIAINGVSLTVNDVTDTEFKVMIIPHTLEKTTFAGVQPGECVNIEFDMLARMVAGQVEHYLTLQQAVN